MELPVSPERLVNESEKTLKAHQLELSRLLKEAGADLVGFGQVGPWLPADLTDLPVAISAAVHLSGRIIEEISMTAGPTQTYFHHYRSVNTLLDQMALKAMLQIQRWGYEAMAIPASQSLNEKEQRYRGRFQHRLAATRAGLGWIGKNSCLVTPAYGPRVRLVTILTNMPLATDDPVTESRCGECRRCADACPAGALAGNLQWTPGLEREALVDPSLCSHHMKKAYQHIGRGAVCGICFRVCPWGNQ
ncbi:4Fe-4S double cluster binding domain-containing protein [Anoxynatronum buryatiense]|uniref:4Fe-4S double cluster binding domain-containing protein n=1 Tax=Anoxynatronum buryatiense TaxID=489973 RepID=A0AA45WT95_9CLOT|nr:4Fe-4S double cluster binding domain-containing protein [Anoxynatronum buryatiense]SMP41253.1 4Fe-4S double cluster binding domain-containing protein [Anoxynatronum buryatiense]